MFRTQTKEVKQEKIKHPQACSLLSDLRGQTYMGLAPEDEDLGHHPEELGGVGVRLLQPPGPETEMIRGYFPVSYTQHYHKLQRDTSSKKHQSMMIPQHPVI